MHPQCRVLGRGSEPAYRKKRGALDQDWIRTVLYFRGGEERVTEKMETVVGEGSGKGGALRNAHAARRASWPLG